MRRERRRTKSRSLPRKKKDATLSGVKIIYKARIRKAVKQIRCGCCSTKMKRHEYRKTIFIRWTSPIVKGAQLVTGFGSGEKKRNLFTSSLFHTLAIAERNCYLSEINPIRKEDGRRCNERGFSSRGCAPHREITTEPRRVTGSARLLHEPLASALLFRGLEPR